MGLHSQSDSTIRDVYILEVPVFSWAVFASLAGAVFGLCFGLFRSITAMKAYADSDESLEVPQLTVVMVLKSLLLSGCLSAIGYATVALVVGAIVASLFNAIAYATGGLRVRVRDSRDF